jgi:cytochrome b561
MNFLFFSRSSMLFRNSPTSQHDGVSSVETAAHLCIRWCVTLLLLAHAAQCTEHERQRRDDYQVK